MKNQVKKYYNLTSQIKKLEKAKAKLAALLKAKLPYGESTWGKYKAILNLVEEHTVPAHTVREHYSLTVKTK